VNQPPATEATSTNLAPDLPADIELLPLAGDAETGPDGLLLRTFGALGGNVQLASDGQTACFTPAPGYTGPASFSFSATDTGPDPQLLLHYPFDAPDTASDKATTDHSIHGLVGSLQEFGTGTATFDPSVPPSLAGFSKHSLRLVESGAGNGARLCVRLASSLRNLKDTDWTFAAWVQRDMTAGEDVILYLGAASGGGTGGDELELVWRGDACLELRHYSTRATRDVSLVTATLPAGPWHHVAVLFDRVGTNRGTLSLFANGHLVGTSAAITWALDQNNDLTIGGVRNGAEARWLNGRVDDVMLSRSLLKATDIARLAAGCTVGHLGGQSATNTVSLVLQPTQKPDPVPDTDADGIPDDVDTDDDNDGLPDTWENSQGLDTKSGTALDGAAGDPDGDGASNYQEFVAGTDVLDAASRLQVLESQRPDHHCYRFSFPTASNRFYQVVFRTDLANGPWEVLTNLTGNGSVQSIVDPNASCRQRFYRINVQTHPWP
jgi:hypothetical protein